MDEHGLVTNITGRIQAAQRGGESVKETSTSCQTELQVELKTLVQRDVVTQRPVK